MIHQTIILTHHTPFDGIEQAIAEYSTIRDDDLDTFFAPIAGSTVMRTWDWDENQRITITTIWTNNEEYNQYMSYETARNDIISRLTANGWTFVSINAMEV
jgi:hypothetical protein